MRTLQGLSHSLINAVRLENLSREAQLSPWAESELKMICGRRAEFS